MSNVFGECSLCHQPLTPYGSLACAEGTICRNCAALLSPFLTKEEVAQMSLQQLNEHIEYRKSNAEALKDLKISKVIDGKYDLYCDQDKKNILFVKGKDAVRQNADIIPLSAVEKLQITKQYNKKDADYVDIFVKVFLHDFRFKCVEFMTNTFPKTDVNIEAYQQAMDLAYEYLDKIKELVSI
ncbi:MAG: hypothetical protein J5887_02920 [Erysipelotrichaceae bacterium]|nr:hypothetical protein [Erysipelotrichaceae bacterium]